jgi:hypothetical protein
MSWKGPVLTARFVWLLGIESGNLKLVTRFAIWPSVWMNFYMTSRVHAKENLAGF